MPLTDVIFWRPSKAKSGVERTTQAVQQLVRITQPLREGAGWGGKKNLCSVCPVYLVALLRFLGVRWKRYKYYCACGSPGISLLENSLVSKPNPECCDLLSETNPSAVKIKAHRETRTGSCCLSPVLRPARTSSCPWPRTSSPRADPPRAAANSLCCRGERAGVRHWKGNKASQSWLLQHVLRYMTGYCSRASSCPPSALCPNHGACHPAPEKIKQLDPPAHPPVNLSSITALPFRAAFPLGT